MLFGKDTLGDSSVKATTFPLETESRGTSLGSVRTDASKTASLNNLRLLIHSTNIYQKPTAQRLTAQSMHGVASVHLLGQCPPL